VAMLVPEDLVEVALAVLAAEPDMLHPEEDSEEMVEASHKVVVLVTPVPHSEAEVQSVVPDTPVPHSEVEAQSVVQDTPDQQSEVEVQSVVPDTPVQQSEVEVQLEELHILKAQLPAESVVAKEDMPEPT
ncbi:hypothetical protein V3C99_014015, partial [Haemonchus contortus]